MKKNMFINRICIIIIVFISSITNIHAQLSFGTAFNYGAGTNPSAVASADFNNDGNPDLAEVNTTSSDLFIYLGSGTGTFAFLTSYTVGSSPRCITSSDFNGDGKIDLAVGDFGSNIVLVLLGSGTGTFSAAVSFTAGTWPRALIASDFNNDGKLDLAVANNGSDNISILLGSGTGTFSAALNYTVGSAPWAIKVEDFNNDGKNDIGVVNGTSNNISILMGSGTGTFSPAVNYAVGSNPRSITMADFNGDGNIDLATANISFADVSVLIGSSTGTFAAAVSYTTGGSFPISITSNDFNGDGKIDLAIGNQSSNNVSVLLGSGTGIFTVGGIYATGTQPSSIASSDFNGDGKPDLVTTNNGSNDISVLLNTSIPPAAPTASFSISSTKCVGSAITFSDQSTYFPTAWTWTFVGGTPSNSTLKNPSITYAAAGTYSAVLTASNSAGSSTVLTKTFVVTTPAISVTNGAICSGQSFTIATSGASTYTFSGGSAVVSPTINTTYSVTGTNSFGCISVAPVISTITVNASKNITGLVTNTASIPVAGFVTLYLYEVGYTKFDSITSIAISGSGAYTFTNAISANKYLVKAFPAAPNYLNTYGNSSSFWKAATPIIHSCLVTSTVNITVLELTPITPGVGSLSGKIEKGPGYGLRTSGLKPLSTPIRGISVKGGRNPGGNIVVQTTTDANGTYTLSGLPNDNYFILVDIPGLDTNGTYHEVLITGSEVFNNLDFTVDSTKINPTNLTVGMQEINISDNSFLIFPNPSSNLLNIHYTLTQSSNIKIELYDLVGKLVKTILDSNNQLADSYKTSSLINDLDSGIYFIKIKINGKENVVKFCISR